jgi:hypothetical protein
MKTKLLLAALAFSTAGLAPLAANADVYVDVAPPAARYEAVPAARPGYVWQQGYWEWNGHRHHWHAGYWVKERRGMYWHPSRWEQRDGRWTFEKGRWDRERFVMRDRDRDGDGVPNRYDRAPDNPRVH